MQASFGGAVSSLFGRQLPLSAASPAGACAPLSNGVAVAGTVALVQRGGCLIAEKARARAITLSEPEPEPGVEADAKPCERAWRSALAGRQGVVAKGCQQRRVCRAPAGVPGTGASRRPRTHAGAPARRRRTLPYVNPVLRAGAGAQARHAQDAGAVAVVVYDNQINDYFTAASDGNAGVALPAVSLPRRLGQLLVSATLARPRLWSRAPRLAGVSQGSRGEWRPLGICARGGHPTRGPAAALCSSAVRKDAAWLCPASPPSWDRLPVCVRALCGAPAGRRGARRRAAS